MNRTSLALVVLTAFVALGCPGQKPPAQPPTGAPAASEGLSIKLSKSGLGFRLSNADDEADRPRARTTSPSTPLAAADAKKMAARLPPLKAEPDDAKDFAMRAKSIPAPRPGKTVTEPFPPPPGPPPATPPAAGPLTVERHAPEGAVTLAPNVSLTFSQPMVAVTSVDALKEHPPVTLVPEPPGQWRWLGTRTLLFQPDKRFPMATTYTVGVPAGTKSLSGGALAAPVKWTFDTPALKLISRWPTNDSVELQPLVFLGFDQTIDAATFVRSVQLTTQKGNVPFTLATPDEVEANATVRGLAHRSEKGRWIALRPDAPLPTATAVIVKVKLGAPSAEGPKKTDQDQSFTFYTYGPMRVTNHSCDGDKCPPLGSLSIGFSNPIDPKKFDPKLVSLSPEVPGLKVEASGNYLTLRGKTKGRTTYTATIGGALADTHGQTMGQAAKVSFDIGPAEPGLFGSPQDMVVLEPGTTPRTYPLYSINEPELRVSLYAVGPEDWEKYHAFRGEWERPRKLAPPGRLVGTKLLKPKKSDDELVTTAVDLAPALTRGLGQVVLVAQSTRKPTRPYERAPETIVWIQSTQLGLSAQVESDRVLAWTTRLADGASEGGVDVSFVSGAAVKSNAEGLATLPLQNASAAVVARKGGDLVLVPRGYRSYEHIARSDQPLWFVYDDRGLYKPGEEVHVKGWVRQLSTARGGDLGPLPNGTGQRVTYKVRDPRGAEIGNGTTSLDDHGSFDFVLKLPANANLGSASVAMTLENGHSASHGFQIQEFRRPEFEVTATSSEGPHVVGKHAVATLNASYYSGGGLPDAPVHWTVRRHDATFVPPNQSAYHFGPEPAAFWSWWHKTEEKSETWTSTTSGQGVHRLRLDFDAVEPPYPMQLDLTGQVTDVNRQEWAGRTTMLVHPSETYVGVKLAKSFLRAGETIEVDGVVVDLDGKPVPGQKASIKAARIDTVWVGEEREERELEVQTCEVESSAPMHCTFKTKEGGTWRVTAVVVDAHGRKNQSATSLWVMGGSMPKDRNVKRQQVNLLLDKKEYAPGALADLLVVSPFVGEALLTVRRQGIVHVERFKMTSTSHQLKVKLDDALVPNATIQVDVAGQDLREDASGHPDERLPKRPAYASGAVEAKILPTSRTLGVSVAPKKRELEPGGLTTVEVDVKEPDGRAAGDAEVAVVVADEAVLALTGYKSPDPIAVFYAHRGADVQTVEMRDHLLLGEPDLNGQVAQPQMQSLRREKSSAAYGGMPGAVPPPPPPPAPAMAPMEEAAMDMKKADSSVVGNATTPIAVRTNFNPLALFAPAVKTDAKGHASVPIKLPDNLTRYRVMAVAANRERSFGSSESTLTARLPVMVRPSAPRFLNFGDVFELPVVVQNQTAEPIEVGVVARSSNAVVDEPSAKRVKIAANDRVEVRFNASAAKAGTARFQVGVAAGAFADASEVELPVHTPATTEAFATYGEIDDAPIAQPVKMPPNVFKEFGGLEITTSSTQLQALTDAYVYLAKYPFECNEQIASRVLTTAALRDVLTAFKAKEMPSPQDIKASMEVDLQKLKRRQSPDGGWGFWQEKPWPYLTAHVAHALARAREKGYAVDDGMWRRAIGYLHQIESYIPAWYGPEARRAIVAYSLYVRGRMKDADPAKARALLAEAGGADKLGIEAVGWIWPTISADRASAAENEAIRRHVANRVTETAGAAHFVSGYKDADWVLLHSDRRADGVLLEAMIGDQKDATLIPKLVKGLLGHRKAGRWYNTQENAFVLLALDKYFATYEKVTPDFVARMWLGEKYAGDHAFKGRTTEYAHVAIPMAMLGAKDQNVVIAKDGPGRLYWRLGMQYAPSDLKLPPADYGFVVSRRYEGVDRPDDVKRDADGTWRVRAGAKVRVRVSMMAPARRHHVALVDWLPAGLEPMNSALATTGEVPKDPKASREGFWSRTWYEHQNLRDERVEAFTSLLWEGVWDYDYVARATTPGTFVVPPAKAEEMYSPETFGRSAGDRLIVE